MIQLRRAALLAALLLAPPPASAISIYSEGMITPETISLAPSSFGAYGGSYFVPDAALHNVWVVPPGGGAPSEFFTGSEELLLGGLFLPDTEQWGAARGRYLTTGRYPDFAPDTEGRVYTYASDGTRELLATVPGARLSQPAIAPEGFGSLGGYLIVSDSVASSGDPGKVWTIAPDGTSSVLAQDPAASSPFGLAFAPAGFGAVGGQLLVGDSRSGAILAVGADGTPSSFATVPLAAGQTGTRQMAFAPAGFVPGFDELLFVSISGSVGGGGTLGDVVALDAGGEVVASLRTDLGLVKFDPRGLLFTDDGNLLISDASDPILFATPADFRRVPAPGTLALLGAGIAALAAGRRRGSGADRGGSMRVEPFDSRAFEATTRLAEFLTAGRALLRALVAVSLSVSGAVAWAHPVNVNYRDDSRCDAIPGQNFRHELGGPEDIIPRPGTAFPIGELILWRSVETVLTDCGIAADGGRGDWRVSITNLSGRSWKDLFFVADSIYSVGNADGTVNGLLRSDAFRIDAAGINKGLMENGVPGIPNSRNDGIFSPGETWDFLVTDFLLLGIAGPAPSFNSLGVDSLNLASTASIVAHPLHEPSPLVLFLGAIPLAAAIRRTRLRVEARAPVSVPPSAIRVNTWAVGGRMPRGDRRVTAPAFATGPAAGSGGRAARPA